MMEGVHGNPGYSKRGKKNCKTCFNCLRGTRRDSIGADCVRDEAVLVIWTTEVLRVPTFIVKLSCWL